MAPRYDRPGEDQYQDSANEDRRIGTEPGHKTSQTTSIHLSLQPGETLSPQRKEELFSAYLKQQLRRPPLDPCPWILHLQPPDDDPAAARVRLLDDPNTRLEQVPRILEDCIAFASSTEMSKDSFRKYVADAQFGSRAFRWLGKHLDRVDPVVNIPLIGPLVHCIVAERSEQQLGDLLFMDLVPAFACNRTAKNWTRWRGTFLRALVLSSIHLDSSESKGLMKAVNQFRFAIKGCRDFEVTGRPFHINTYSAMSELQRYLTTPGWSVETPHDFSWSIDYLPRVRSNVHEKAFVKTRLTLYHPTEASAMPAFEVLQRVDEMWDGPLLESAKSHLIPTSHPSAVRILHLLIQTMQILHRQGEYSKARWVLDCACRRVPRVITSDPNRLFLPIRSRANDVWAPAVETLSAGRMRNVEAAERSEHRNSKWKKRNHAPIIYLR
ncbi:Hypothetical predicted protein [Lecanosticta acicola]|uniref:Uncharacterized protein n=1 Tax=Lecanosticta acicola TaxID=111012 RepID=A0AAI8Z5F1_9PEZI|nr:Hypothetical predicted protein [Lecanosticta acicola]